MLLVVYYESESVHAGRESIEVEQVEGLLEHRVDVGEAGGAQVLELVGEYGHVLLPAHFDVRRRLVQRQQHVAVVACAQLIAAANLFFSSTVNRHRKRQTKQKENY